MTTQYEQARAGTISPEMQQVAQRERIAPELVRDEIAAGRLVIPANKLHLAGVPYEPKKQGCHASVRGGMSGETPTESDTNNEETAKKRQRHASANGNPHADRTFPPIPQIRRGGRKHVHDPPRRGTLRWPWFPAASGGR